MTLNKNKSTNPKGNPQTSNKKDDTIKNALILFVITIVAALILGFSYNITLEPIAAQELKTRDTALNSVMPNATFTEIPIENTQEYQKLMNVFEAKDDTGTLLGYAFKLGTKEGYSDIIELIVGIDLEGNITGIDIIKQNETPGLGAKADDESFKSQYIGKVADVLEVVKQSSTNEQDILAISGATITSKAVTNAVNEGSNYFNTILKKGGQINE